MGQRDEEILVEEEGRNGGQGTQVWMIAYVFRARRAHKHRSADDNAH